MNQPSGSRASLVQQPARAGRARTGRRPRAATACSAAPSTVPTPSSASAANAERPQPGLVGAGQQQPGEFDQQHERRQLDQRDHRLQHPGDDQRRLQRRQQPARGLRPPAARAVQPRESVAGASAAGTGVTVGRGGLLLVTAALLAHRPPAIQYAWACISDLGKPNSSLSRVRTCLRVVDSGVAQAYQSDQSRDLDRRGERLLVAAGAPSAGAAAGASAIGISRVVFVVQFEVQLDRARRRAIAPMMPLIAGDRGGVADQQVARGRFVGHVEARRTHSAITAMRRAGLRRSSPTRGGPGGFVQHDVDREMAACRRRPRRCV